MACQFHLMTITICKTLAFFFRFLFFSIWVMPTKITVNQTCVSLLENMEGVYFYTSKEMWFSLHSWKSVFFKDRFTFLFFPPTSRVCSELVFCQKQQGELAGDPNPEGREPVDPVVRRLAEGQSVNSDWLPGRHRAAEREPETHHFLLLLIYLADRGGMIVRILWLWCATLAPSRLYSKTWKVLVQNVIFQNTNASVARRPCVRASVPMFPHCGAVHVCLIMISDWGSEVVQLN